MISDSNNKKLSQIKIHLEIILAEGFKIIEENKDYFNIYHSLFRRYIYGLDSVKILLQDFSSEKKHREQSLSIILRASLLDYLTTLYLGTFQAEKKFNPELKKNYEVEIDKFTSEQIRRIISIPEKDRQTSLYNHEELCKNVNLLRERFSHLFNSEIPINYNEPAKSLIYKTKDDIKSITIRNRLDEVSNQLEGIRHEDVFYLYDMYSKYDHFGTASMLLEYMDINIVYHNVFASMFHISQGIVFCTDLMQDETECKSNFDKIISEIIELRSLIYNSRK